jgi:hypothetical protein
MTRHIGKKGEVGRSAEHDSELRESADDVAAARLISPPPLQRRVLVVPGQDDRRSRHEAEVGAQLIMRLKPKRAGASFEHAVKRQCDWGGTYHLLAAIPVKEHRHGGGKFRRRSTGARGTYPRSKPPTSRTRSA